VSGVPGIGKTLCVKDVAQKVCERGKAKLIYVNALTIKKPIDIFKVIHYEMTRKKL
jgi:Cdc6-like AAA superfamily ATPase